MAGNNIVRNPTLLFDGETAAVASGDLTTVTDGQGNVHITNSDGVIQTDHRFKEVNERCYFGSLTSGDSIIIEAKFRPTDASWRAIESITDVNFAGVLRGPWPFIRVRKVGTAGAATFDILG